ncbi:unnamed protein product [Bemisia tabaci]|uniref:Immunoglobulin V-set domain-containing protein n=1 Tax=Bemisia tabaci TaxID=7038 RepID=A0A9P0AEA3_BEMTA|nr:unnamed protein product [Bemisia tabaci]
MNREAPFELGHPQPSRDAENDERHVTLKNVNFSASGLYSCAVSLESPIFTKASNEAELTVMRKLNKIYVSVVFA